MAKLKKNEGNGRNSKFERIVWYLCIKRIESGEKGQIKIREYMYRREIEASLI